MAKNKLTCGKTNTTRTDGEGEDFTDDDPRRRTPGGSEHGDVQADEGNHGAGSIGVGRVVGRVLASCGTNGTDDELHNDHTSGTVDQDGAATELLDHDERGWGRKHVDEGSDKTDQEGVRDGAKLLEEDGTEVEDEVLESRLDSEPESTKDKLTIPVNCCII